ncbi:MAG: AraC family transcriptional regulator [Pseudomonadales bacterium]|nr:AraC family transcriptional regulator [Pseudomonadales bacterium]NRA16321.1 AraC family transcriptional regulator ligand-binding domain-containing protein [Oceanospirillaceae bacterium]
MATVDMHYARAILQCSVRQGRSVRGILQDVQLTPELLASHQQRIAGEKITQLVKYIWAKLQDEFMGCTDHPCKPGVFALMARHSLRYDSLQEVLLQGLHFYDLFTDDIKMQLVKRGKLAELSIHFKQPQLDPGNFFQEFWLMIWHRFASWVIGRKIALNQIYFPYPKPDHHLELKNAFPCRHNYNRNGMKISFSSEYLSLAPVRTQTDLSIFLKNSPADLITIPGDENNFKAKIRTLLLHQQQEVLCCPDFERLAQSFNVSSQTLRRRLKSEGTSYPQIKDQIRRDLAIEKLLSQTVAIADIARCLGFSESRSFSRAFKKWTDYTPTDYMAKQED